MGEPGCRWVRIGGQCLGLVGALSLALACSGQSLGSKAVRDESPDVQQDAGEPGVEGPASAGTDEELAGGEAGGAGSGDGGVPPSSDPTAIGDQQGPVDDPTSAPSETCVGDEAVVPKRLVRLTLVQIVNSIATLLDDELAAEIAERHYVVVAGDRAFPPLLHPAEGSFITDTQFQVSDAIAQDAAEYVVENFAAVTGCDSASTDAERCARDFTAGFLERAYRRPVTAAELTQNAAVFDLALQLGEPLEEAVRYGVYAALSSPHFLYRTEFGADAPAAQALSPFELASALSFFITDMSPDVELLQAAESGALRTSAELEAQAGRLLNTAAARQNLETLMYSYFGIERLQNVVLSDTRWTSSFRSSAQGESERFISHTLWQGDVAELITSRTSFVDETLAELYDVPFPPADAALDEAGFAQVTLPEFRSGLITQSGFLTGRSRPNGTSVVGRGFLLNETLVCQTLPPPPEVLADDSALGVADLSSLSEREKAELRMADPTCGSCHAYTDPLGLAVDNVDLVGAYRAVDAEGRTIDATVTLPETLGGVTVSGPADMGRAFVESGAFTACLSRNLLHLAFAEGPTVEPGSCVNRAVVDRFDGMDGSFSSLVVAIAGSTPFTERVDPSELQ